VDNGRFVGIESTGELFFQRRQLFRESLACQAASRASSQTRE
jgi:hypothetical protein